MVFRVRPTPVRHPTTIFHIPLDKKTFAFYIRYVTPLEQLFEQLSIVAESRWKPWVLPNEPQW